MKRKLAILGSTGSIGTQALEVVAQYRDQFEVYALTANNNVDLLIRQAVEFEPEVVVIGNETHYPLLKESLKELPIKVYAGQEAIAQVVQAGPIDMVLTAMVGYAGLAPTINAIKAKKTIALANKETLVVAGELIVSLVNQYEAPILPVDSEHSAIFQCLMGEQNNSVEKIILTASGGPFRTYSYDQLRKVTKKEALKHPNWEMGAKITIDSATLMNKGFEVIEGKWLFGLKGDQIDVVIHPQSIIHSMVQFTDGSIKAQMGLPDMKLPIAYALSFPNRLSFPNNRMNFAMYPSLTFETPDPERFPCLSLAYQAMRQGGVAACAMNAANEIVVEAFLNDKIPFLSIPSVIETMMEKAPTITTPSYEDYVETNKMIRILTKEHIGNGLS
ncbi:MAG: 1-deoxy-D-xylulose-5-phosphate reductoisomerase [Bacteroidales bacterium]